jgi:hypothetical protein
MQESESIGQEMAAEALEKSKLLVSFAVTPAAQKPRMTNMVYRLLDKQSSKNLEDRFKEEDDAADKVEWSWEELEAPRLEEGTNKNLNELPFLPSVGQWNSLISRVESLSTELDMARQALKLVAEGSDNRFETIDGQVANLRGSIGK